MPQNQSSSGLDGLVADPQFQSLAPFDQRRALSGVTGDDAFSQLSDEDTQKYVNAHLSALNLPDSLTQQTQAAARAAGISSPGTAAVPLPNVKGMAGPVPADMYLRAQQEREGKAAPTPKPLAQPVMPLMGVGALPFLRGLAGGYAAQKGAQYGAKELGFSPTVQQWAGDISGILGAGLSNLKELPATVKGDPAANALSTSIQDSGINNTIAENLRYPATARQSQVGRPGTIKPILPSFLQRYTIPDWAIPKGDVGTPTNPGPFAELPVKVKPPAPEVDPVASAVRSRTAAWLPTRVKPAAPPEAPPPSPFSGMMSTSPSEVSGLPAATVRQASEPVQPNVQYVTKFAPQKGLVQDPNSPPPDVRVTYQSVPQADLQRLVMSGDRNAILEWQRRGLQLPENVGYMVEQGAGNLPWRRYRR